ncbi:hypothetical protein KP509_31G051000 [Ceratopteris richardii]|nr:hypothetical protein KP509_31G051000 [Ceratopteris richardii]KAH7288934.1 hypothetical protein KP509_31G051000 [Ceratopteris richardii]
MQSKIRVYESGRSEQDYDPDLPPELAAAAGLQESSEKVQQRQLDADTVGAGMGRRIYTPMPLGRPIEVEGGIADRRPSADSRKQRIRDSDSILLIDAVENEDLETEVLHDENMEGMDVDVDKDEVDQDEQQIEGHGIDEEEHLMESVRAPFKTKQEQHIWKKERMPKVQSKPPAEERRELEYAQSFDANLHEVESKADIDTSEKFTEPSDKHEIENHKDDMVHIHAEEHHGVQSIAQKVEDASIAVSKEKLSWEVQADSSGCSSKRQRPVSPEGSHTASWDNLDLQKSTRSTTYTKESRDSGESAFDSREDTSRHRKKHKSYSDLSRADMHRDSRHETDFYHKRQVSNRQEVESEVHLYTESVQETTKRQKQGVSDKVTSKDFVKHSRHREDVRGRTREDDIEKKIHLVKDVREAVDHKDKVGSKSDSRRREEEERDVSHYRERGSRSESRKKEVERRDRHDSRRREPEDRRERPEKESQHREFREIHHRDTEVEPFDWHTSDRRKKEEDHRRKDRPEDSDVFTKKERGRDIFEKHEREEDDHRRKDRPADAGIFTKKERGKEILEKHERDSDLYTRKKEELSKKEKVEDRHKTKVRDGTLKDSEESRQRNTDYQDSQKRSHKDEERLSHSGRSSRRHDEDRGERAWRGRDESRMSDSTRSSEHRSHSKDRRRLLEDHGKEKGRSHEGHVRSCIDHEGAQIVENHDRDPGKHSRLSDGSRTLERSLQSDKHRIDSKRNKDFDREINEAATQSAENTAYSKRKRSVPEKNEQGSGRLEESSSAKARDGQAIKAVLGDARESHDSKFGKSSSKLQLSDDRASSAEDERQKGRSKLERWMSHKDLDSDILLRQSILKRDEKPKSSSRDEKHRDSFEARVYPQQDTKHHVGIDRKSDKGSSTEQVNGKASKLKEKGDAGTFSKGDANTDKKDEHHQEDAAVLQTNMAAKLEKRKERFKVTMEDKEGARKLVQGENQLVDKDDSRQERPPRKRRWASG